MRAGTERLTAARRLTAPGSCGQSVMYASRRGSRVLGNEALALSRRGRPKPVELAGPQRISHPPRSHYCAIPRRRGNRLWQKKRIKLKHHGGTTMSPTDELLIRNVIARVAWLTDKWSSEAEYLANYTEDCVWHLQGVEPYRGHAGMGRRLREMLAAGVCGPGLPMRHCVTSVEVIADPVDPDTATARSFVIMTTIKNGAATMEGCGEMIDTFRRSSGGWKIAVRRGALVSK